MKATGSEYKHNFMHSIRCQETARHNMASERVRLANRQALIDAAVKECGGNKDDPRIAEQFVESEGYAMIQAPSGWPIVNRETRMIEDSGLPNELDMIMQVVPIGKFKGEKNLLEFTSAVGEVPELGMFQLTEMMFQSNARQDGKGKLPASLFMMEETILNEYQRMRKYEGNNALASFYQANYYGELFSRSMLLFQTFNEDPVTQMEMYKEYIECAYNQYRSLVVSGNLNSKHARYAFEYINTVDESVCGDLRKLYNEVFAGDIATEEALDVNNPENDIMEMSFANQNNSYSYWKYVCSSAFMRRSWEIEEMHKRFNDQFFLLTPQNLRILKDARLSSIMFRMGQHNNFTWIGLPTVICDAFCKLKVRVPNTNIDVYDSRKGPSRGADIVRENTDCENTMVNAVIAKANTDDNEGKLQQIKRTTANGMQTGFYVVDATSGEVMRPPENNLAGDCMFPEGPPDSFEAMQQLFTAIPRDGEHDSTLWTTIDKDKTNNRVKGVMKLVSGFSIFSVLMATNFLYEHKTQNRFLDLLIVCNVQCASAPCDIDGLHGKLQSNERDAFKLREDTLDDWHPRHGLIANCVNPKNKKKGDKPNDKDQRKWAPLKYFGKWVSGVGVALFNKMGGWKINIGYHVKSLSDYLYHVELSTLRALITEDNLTHASRYYESYISRCAGDTLYKTTVSSMLLEDTVHDSILSSTRSLSYNGLDLSLLPVVHECLIGRLIEFEPVLGAAVFALHLNVPVIRLENLLKFFNCDLERNEETAEDLDLLKGFVERCARDHMFVNKGGLDFTHTGMPMQDPVPYITCGGDWNSGMPMLRETVSAGNDGKQNPVSAILKTLAEKVYKANEAVLRGCAECKENFSWQRCTTALQAEMNLQPFFGGMSKFHDSAALLAQLGPMAGVDPRKFPSNFIHADQGDRDHFLRVAKLSGEVHAISVHIWHMLLWVAIMGRPRRDFGILHDFAHTLTRYVMGTLPKSVFPYEMVPMCRTDHINLQQVVMDLSTGRDHQVIPRFRNPTIVTKNFVMECKGRGKTKVLEDEAWFANIYMIAEALMIEPHDVPIDKWLFTVDVAWEQCYPLMRYPNAKDFIDDGDKKTGFVNMARKCKDYQYACVFLNPTTCTAVLTAVTPESLQELRDTGGDSEDYVPDVEKLQEFTLTDREGPFVTQCEDMQQIFSCIAYMGFGPMIKIARSGVAVEFEGCIGCVVAHECRRHECEYSEFNTCYLCPHNPFYEVCFERDGLTKRAPPNVVAQAALPVGQSLLLDMNSPELKELLDEIGGSAVRGHNSRHRKKRRLKYRNSTLKASLVDASQQQQQQQSQSQQVRDPDNWLLVRLDVPRIFTPREGMIYVSVEITYTRSRDVVDSRGFYVHPSDLAMPENLRDEELVRRRIVL